MFKIKLKTKSVVHVFTSLKN